MSPRSHRPHTSCHRSRGGRDSVHPGTSRSTRTCRRCFHTRPGHTSCRHTAVGTCRCRGHRSCCRCSRRSSRHSRLHHSACPCSQGRTRSSRSGTSHWRHTGRRSRDSRHHRRVCSPSTPVDSLVAVEAAGAGAVVSAVSAPVRTAAWVSRRHDQHHDAGAALRSLPCPCVVPSDSPYHCLAGACAASCAACGVRRRRQSPHRPARRRGCRSAPAPRPDGRSHVEFRQRRAILRNDRRHCGPLGIPWHVGALRRFVHAAPIALHPVECPERCKALHRGAAPPLTPRRHPQVRYR
jgi:hypothetical protein